MTTLLVQSDRILSNYRLLQKQSRDIPLLPVLEGNAHGLGDAAVARFLVNEGVRTLAVARLEEAVRVAEAVRGVDILLLTPYAGEADVEAILENDLIAAVGSNDEAVLLSSLASQLHRRARAQLCFDFGVGRFGYEPQEASKAAQTLRRLGNVDLTGVFTILPRKGSKARRLDDRKRFDRVLAALEREELHPPVLHMADTTLAAQYPALACGAVRTDGDLFGRGPAGERHGLKKVGRLVSEISDLKWLKPGATVGEDGKCRVRRATHVAVVPAGVADGLGGGAPRSFRLFRGASCEINGRRAPLIGKPGLTSLTVDVTDIECAPGDIVSFDADPLRVSAFVRRDYV